MKQRFLTFFAAVLLLSIFFGCSKFKGNQTVPAYIRIDTIQLQIPSNNPIAIQGVTPTSAIKDAWVYVNDVFIGAFELPATFPVLHRGECRITVRPGVLLNGINTTRERYPFYTVYEHTHTLKEDSVTHLTDVVVQYQSVTGNNDGNYYVKLVVNENFEDANTIFDTMTGSHTTIQRALTENDDNELYNNWLGKIELNSEHPTCKIIVKDLYDEMPRILYQSDLYQAVFLEFDYKSTASFFVGTETFWENSSECNDFLGVFPNEKWRKMYINLTNRIINDQVSGATGFKFYFIAELPEGSDHAEIYLDNIRWVHFIQ